MRPSILLILTLLFLTCGLPGAIQQGASAPDFSLPDASGTPHRLSSYRGQTVILYFYPKDDTPGCTREACNLRDHFEALTSRHLVVLGVSYDTPESHRSFSAKHSLPFLLLSDSGKQVARLYGADGIGFAKRITFVIGPDGKVLRVIDPVDAGNHARQILDALDSGK